MVDNSNSHPSHPALGQTAKTDGFFVVGIGASAGGVGALRQFFSQVKSDCGMSFVVVLHLSPQHDSSLPALIQSQTGIPVTQVTEGVRVEPNHVYVIPPNKYLVMVDGSIRLTEPERMRGSHTSIDLVFRTLADAYHKDAIAILLSGTGTDGTLGLRRIKEEGGFVIAEDPGEAEYPDMPRSAIDSGMVDLVLPVAEMADKLRSLHDGAQRLQVPAESEEEPPGIADEATLREILALLRVRTGHDFAQYRRPTLMRRIARRMQVHEVTDVLAYLDLVREHPDELNLLLRDLLITVTNFFRDHECFEFLERQIIPQLFDGKTPADQVRVWSAGCATGEEAYSLAMLLSEYAGRLTEPPRLQVFASDIDERAIAEARDPHYPPTISLDVSPERLRQFFVKDGNRYRIKKELREMVLCAPHNVLRDPPFSRLDLICCRNLLIYLKREMQQRVLNIFHFALRPQGFLFLGASESAEIAPSLFAPTDKKIRVYSRRAIADAARPAPELMVGKWQVNYPVLPEHPENVGSIGQLHSEVVEQLAPPSVLINEDFDIMHISANAGRYLHIAGGEPSHNLLKTVHPALRLDLHAALLEAKNRLPAGAAQTRRLRVELQAKASWVSAIVRSVLQTPEPARGFFLVIFDEVSELPPTDAEQEPVAANTQAVRHLEQELQRTKEQLRLNIEQYETSTEELRASNEELQAINEELRSATEELETGKEELQSVNEELSTVNQEYRERIEEVGRANNDLQNLMASTDIGTIFLDRALQIKRYTPRAQQLFNITPADIGRPLEHFTHKLDYHSLSADADELLRTLHTTEREVRSEEGRWYLARLLPYRTSDDRIDGVVLTFIDITERRQADEQLREQAARLREQAEIVALADIMVRDAHDRILLWSAGSERLYGYTREQAVGRNVHELLQTEFGQPLEEINAELRRSEQWQGELIFTSRAGKRIIAASRWILYQPDQSRPVVVLQVNTDITARRLAEEALRQADRNKDQFLATLAHELRSPLGAMLNSVELLHRPGRSAREIGRARELLQRQIRYLLRLVDDLLDVERLAQGKITLQKKRVLLSEIVDGAMEICRPLSTSGSHHFTISIPPEPVLLEVDPERIAQVVANLVHNAFKYTPPGGRIEFAAEVDDDEVTIRIRDTGLGIDPRLLPHIFDMYTQGATSPGTGIKGLGVGLALVRQLVELHGGNVAAQSEGPRSGSEFTVRLPILAQNSAEQEKPSSSSVSTGASAQPRNLLIVDDHRDAADALSALLQDLGHQVTTSYDGLSALNEAKTHRPEVVIMDIGLPDMNGHEVAAQIRELLPGSLLIALSGWLAEDADRSDHAGFDHYLVKPVEVEQLTRLLAKV